MVHIQAIKQLQQERSLSLDAIRKVLQNFDYDALRAGDSLSRFEATLQSHVNGTLHSDQGAQLSAHDAAIVELWAKLLALGFGGRKSYGSSYLKRFSITNEIFGRLRTQAILQALHEKVDSANTHE